MIQTVTENNQKEAEFYSKPFLFSFSSLNTLVTAPKAFYKEYVLKEKEDEFKKYLIEGILIHYLVLENMNFDNKFIVAGDDLPSENNILITERIFNTLYQDKLKNAIQEATALGTVLPTELYLKDFANEIDSILTEINLHQTIKDSAKRLAKVVEPKAEAYFNFLKTKNNRTIIDSAMLDKCTKRANIIKSNSQMRELLGLDIQVDGKNFGVYNELSIEIPAEELNLPFGFKGILDNMVIDVKNKLVRINDFKTTGKSLPEFPEAVKFWNYWIQAVMYVKLINKFLHKILTDNWNIEFRFLVFDKYDQLYPFLVSAETLDKWTIDFENIIKEATYHYNFKDFSLPYAYARGDVKL